MTNIAPGIHEWHSHVLLRIWCWPKIDYSWCRRSLKLKARRQSIKLARLTLRERPPVVPLSVEDRIPKSLLWQKDVVVCHWLTRSSCHLPLGKVTRSFHFATLHVQTSALIPQQLFPNRVNILSLFYFPPTINQRNHFQILNQEKYQRTIGAIPLVWLLWELCISAFTSFTPLGTPLTCRIQILWTCIVKEVKMCFYSNISWELCYAMQLQDRRCQIEELANCCGLKVSQMEFQMWTAFSSWSVVERQYNRFNFK